MFNTMFNLILTILLVYFYCKTINRYHHHHAVGRDATKTASITCLLLSLYLFAVRVMSMSLSASRFFCAYVSIVMLVI